LCTVCYVAYHIPRFMSLRYLDLDLHIARDPTGSADVYTARVLASPVGPATSQFRVPFGPGEVDAFAAKMAAVAGMQNDLWQNETLTEFGETLFDALFRNELLVCFSRSMDHARQQGRGLRIKLRLHEAPELLPLPWEYLYHRTFRRFLTLSTQTSLVHFVELPEPAEPPLVATPMRVLAVFATPTDLPPLDVERERQNLHTALADLAQRNVLEIDFLDNPSLMRLQRTLRRHEYHILHFVGHGEFDVHHRQGALFLADETGRALAIDGQRLGILLHNERSLRLVVLNACEGSRTALDDLFAGVAQSLVQQGVSAVVAMHAAISDGAAIVFSHEFYAALADGYPVDAAVTEARVAVSTRQGGGEWGAPRLLMHATDGVLWRMNTGAPNTSTQSAASQTTLAAQTTNGTNAAREEAREETGTLAGTIRRDLHVLTDFVQLPEVRATIARFRSDFRAASEQVTRLGQYKDLHDLLHSLEFLCYKGIVREAQRFPDDEMALVILTDHELTLREITDRLRDVAEGADLAAYEMNWLDNIGEAQQKLSDALENDDPAQLRRAIRLLKRVLDRTPSRINERLNATARALRLRTIEEALRAIYDKMVDLRLDPDKVQQFETAVVSIDVVNGSLQALVDEHDRWQLFDLELRRIESQAAHDLSEIEFSWPDLSEMATALYAGVSSEWAVAFDRDRQQLEVALQNQNPARIRLYFQRLRRQAGNRFYQVDTELRTLCDELQQTGEPLALALRMLEVDSAL